MPVLEVCWETAMLELCSPSPHRDTFKSCKDDHLESSLTEVS